MGRLADHPEQDHSHLRILGVPNDLNAFKSSMSGKALPVNENIEHVQNERWDHVGGPWRRGVILSYALCLKLLTEPDNGVYGYAGRRVDGGGKTGCDALPGFARDRVAWGFPVKDAGGN